MVSNVKKSFEKVSFSFKYRSRSFSCSSSGLGNGANLLRSGAPVLDLDLFAGRDDPDELLIALSSLAGDLVDDEGLPSMYC